MRRDVKRLGGWMPCDANVTAAFINKLRDQRKVRLERGAVAEAHKVNPAVSRFRDLIEQDPTVRMLLTKMIDQVPSYYKDQVTGYLHSIDEMLDFLDHIIGKSNGMGEQDKKVKWARRGVAPIYDKTDLVGFPINVIFDWTMAMPAGYEFFRNHKVNEILREILNAYGLFLDSKESCYVLNSREPDGWFCDDALIKLGMDQYEKYDPGKDYGGYDSWNDFFIRKFKEGERNVAAPHDPKTIVSACESEVYNIYGADRHGEKLKMEDWFWVKSQPYSLRDLLAAEDGDKEVDTHYESYVKPFKGGVVFQAFLAATKYHRWHSPVSGVVEKAYVKQGTYYSQSEDVGMDLAGPDMSQGYIAHVATRAIIYIRMNAKEKHYENGKYKKGGSAHKLMCAIFIGMAEVSSCVISSKIKDRLDHNSICPITKGDELGYFQYGGSSHCLVFEEGCIDEFTCKVGDDVLVCGKIGTLK